MPKVDAIKLFSSLLMKRTHKLEHLYLESLSSFCDKVRNFRRSPLDRLLALIAKIRPAPKSFPRTNTLPVLAFFSDEVKSFITFTPQVVVIKLFPS